jgi:hypothetical protein
MAQFAAEVRDGGFPGLEHYERLPMQVAEQICKGQHVPVNR